MLNRIIIEKTFKNFDDIINFLINRNIDEEAKNMLITFSKLDDSQKSIYYRNILTSHIDFIYNLSYFNKILEAPNLKTALSENTVKPLFYLLAKAYIEGQTFNNQYFQTIPLAVCHPLNNERIRMQNAVFTVFPYPNSGNADKSLDYLCMEKNPHLLGSLCKIILNNPKRISEELKRIGVRKSWLYFEQERITKEIEHKI